MELPAILFLAFIAVGLPLLGLATLSYRGAVFDTLVKSACSSASRAHSFHDAQAQASSLIQSGSESFNGITVENLNISIVTRNLESGSEIESFAPLAPGSINSQSNLYFIKVSAKGSIRPIMQMHDGLLCSASVPGLTEPYKLAASCQLFAERPKGLAY
jgi:hypothetical protein